MERGFVCWLSGWVVSSWSLSWSLGWLFSACIFELWDGEKGGGEGEGGQEAVLGGLVTAPSIFIFTAAFSFSSSLSFLLLGCESSRSSSSGGHEDGRGPRLDIPGGKLDCK